MTMWLRIAGALVVTVAVTAFLENFGASWMLGRSGDEVAPQARSRELFWSLIFAVVMATAVLAAVRRWAGRLRQAAAALQPSSPPERGVGAVFRVPADRTERAIAPPKAH